MKKNYLCRYYFKSTNVKFPLELYYVIHTHIIVKNAIDLDLQCEFDKNPKNEREKRRNKTTCLK